jgi:CRISPR/Cas system Type II protein with McrA/HNH and RuvC-like nuclease domain
MARIGTDVKVKPEASMRWSHHDRTDEDDESFLREVAVTELEPREASEDELALRVRMAAQKRSGIERRKRRIEAIKRMVPRCVEYLGGGWTVRKNGYRYHLKRAGVKVQLNFDLWGSVPRTPGKVKATLEKGSVKLTGNLDSLGWALVLLP